MAGQEEKAVPANLQLLVPVENLRKHNRFDIDQSMPHVADHEPGDN